MPPPPRLVPAFHPGKDRQPCLGLRLPAASIDWFTSRDASADQSRYHRSGSLGGRAQNAAQAWRKTGSGSGQRSAGITDPVLRISGDHGRRECIRRSGQCLARSRSRLTLPESLPVQTSASVPSIWSYRSAANASSTNRRNCISAESIASGCIFEFGLIAILRACERIVSRSSLNATISES